MSDQAEALAVKPTPPVAEVLVWDVPVRVFHGLLVFSVAGAWLSAESERWRWWHDTWGYTTLGLMAFRLVWGWVGTRHARFADFVRSPAVVLAYVRKMVRLRAPRHVGHNPLGAWAVLALIAGVQLFCFGLLAELQMRTYHESQGRPIYRVRAALRGNRG